jgi:hypothetical protein
VPAHPVKKTFNPEATIDKIFCSSTFRVNSIPALRRKNTDICGFGVMEESLFWTSSSKVKSIIQFAITLDVTVTFLASTTLKNSWCAQNPREAWTTLPRAPSDSRI